MIQSKISPKVEVIIALRSEINFDLFASPKKKRGKR